MSFGSRAAAVFDACGTARAVAAASKQSTAKPAWILMDIPSLPILSAPLRVEKLIPTAYNSSSCLSLRALACYKEFLPVVLFSRRGADRLFEQRSFLMAHVIAEPCIRTKDTACADV